jgi:micrococcal nuclease
MDRDRVAVASLLLLVALAGCAGVVDSVSEPPSDAPGGEPGTGSASNGTEFRVTVLTVVDGDTIDIRYANGTTDTVRMLGVDTPEVYGGTDPAEFEGVPDSQAGRECLSEAGDAASAALRDRIASADMEVTLVVDGLSDRRGDYGRLLAYVEVNGTDVTRWLVADGYARVYDSTFARSGDYYAAESAARDAGTGLWTCRSPDSTDGLGDTGGTATANGLRVADVHYDAAGNDNENLNDEYVVFENAGEATLLPGGWTVRDEAGHTYAFPDGFELGPGELVTLYTGSGRDTATALYWGRSGAVWNNGGDTVTIVDESGGAVLELSY